MCRYRDILTIFPELFTHLLPALAPSLNLHNSNNDGKLTKDEFREGSKCDPWIVEALTTPHR